MTVKVRDVQTVWEAWKASTGRERSVLDGKRERRIRVALLAFPLADVLDAVDGWRFSPHHAGENERLTVYNDIELILRDASHIERFRDLKQGAAWTRPASLSRRSPGEIRAAIARGEV